MPRVRLGALDATLVSPSGPVTHAVVLCHGFGAPGDDLVSLAGAVKRVVPRAGEHVVFVFPEGPVRLADLGPGARAWWRLDGERYSQRAAREGVGPVSREVPPTLEGVRKTLGEALTALTASTGVPRKRMVLGGFSQGAMVSVDAALWGDEAPFGVAALSGALIAEAVWRERATQRKPMPVVVTHGRQDPMLPFEAGQRLAELFERAGHLVDFVPFDGGHAIPPPAVQALAGQVHRLLGA